MSADIDIVIVNWNAGDMLRECVQSALETGGQALGRVIVVDNGSVDRSLEQLPDDPRLLVIETRENLGFGRACNRGASLAQGRYVLFLNPDTRLYPTTLTDVLAYMDSQDGQEVGVCGIRLIEDDGAIQHHTTAFPTSRDIYRVDAFRTDFDHQTDRRVSHVIGAFYFMRRALFKQLGGFDERFFVYFEDLDLSYRVHQAGWGIQYLASAAAYHKGGGTSDAVKARRLSYSLTSRLRYARKHFSRPGNLLVLATTLLVEPPLRLLRAVQRRSPQEARETLTAYAMLLKRAR